MPLILRGKSYPMPKEGDSAAPTGREIVAIEDHFGLDGLTLISQLAPDAKQIPGYSKVKALYALVWIAMTRAGEIVSIDDILNEYGVDEIEIKDSAPKALTAEDSSAEDLKEE
jgi:hypothetical protein